MTAEQTQPMFLPMAKKGGRNLWCLSQRLTGFLSWQVFTHRLSHIRDIDMARAINLRIGGIILLIP